MRHDQQSQKVKLYRTLKILFYVLGLPLFVFAVLLTTIKYVGHDPFVGTSEFTGSLGFFTRYEQLATSPALLGLWLALGIWLLISIVHFILSKTIKSRRVRMFSVVAVCLAVLLGGSLVMDAVFDAQITAIQEEAPAGVAVEDYRTQLSYYRMLTSDKQAKDRTLQLIDRVETLQKIYNVGMVGINKTGTAGNTANKPVTYYNVINDEGKTGVDIGFIIDPETGLYKLNVDTDGNYIKGGDGQITKNVEGQIIRLEPDADGNLVINGEVYSHYFYVKRAGSNGVSIYEWYAIDLMPTGFSWDISKASTNLEFTDGIYGEGIYNESGLLSDGYIPSLINVLNVLEQYYEAQHEIEVGGTDKTNMSSYAAYKSYIEQNALEARDDYYNGRIPDPDTGEYVDPWMTAYYNQDAEIEAKNSITRAELDALLAKVGALLGDNSLFDYLFINPDEALNFIPGLSDTISGFLGMALSTLIRQLNQGMSLYNLLASFSQAALAPTIADWIGTVTGHGEGAFKDVYIVFSYKTWNITKGEPENKDTMSEQELAEWRNRPENIVPNLYLAIVAADGEGKSSVMRDPTNPDNILLDVDLSDRLLGVGEDGNPDYAFDLDHLSRFINVALKAVIDRLNFGSTVDTVVGLLGDTLGLLKDIDVNGETYKGIVIDGINLSIPLFNEAGEIAIDIDYILMDLLTNYYNYQSIAIKPVWEFYTWYSDDVNDTYKNAAYWYQQYERAHYEATIYSNMMGSTIIGENLGDGTYPASFGLSDLTAIRQLQTDLSYKPTFYPLFSLRDMMLIFSGIVVMFYFLSFVAAEKEELFATGKSITKHRQKELMEQMEEKDHATTTAAPIGAASAVVSGGVQEVKAVEKPEKVTHRSAAALKAASKAPAKEGTAVPVKAKSNKGVK